MISIVVVLITEKALFVVVYQESAKINAKHEAEARGQEREKLKLMTEHTTYQEQNKTLFQYETILYVINHCLKTNHQDQTSSPILLALEYEFLLLGWQYLEAGAAGLPVEKVFAT